ncbi:MAG: DoxX family protein [Crocinitomicaceae bacterium]|nr:DoxX family protein [Crocinitomicaceae bacterium]
MENLSMMAQIAVALSVAFVWTFRYHNVITEFKTFGLSDLTRNLVGVSKIALATLLVTGIWFPAVLLPAALLMGFFMVSAQGFHFKIKNTFIKHLPSLILLVLCGFIAFEAMN